MQDKPDTSLVFTHLCEYIHTNTLSFHSCILDFSGNAKPYCQCLEEKQLQTGNHCILWTMESCQTSSYWMTSEEQQGRSRASQVYAKYFAGTDLKNSMSRAGLCQSHWHWATCSLIWGCHKHALWQVYETSTRAQSHWVPRPFRTSHKRKSYFGNCISNWVYLIGSWNQNSE